MEIVQDFLYGVPKPPGKVRTEPLQVICVGLPRSATESLSIGLHKLGLNSYHGWDILFEEDQGYPQEWALLARRKFRGAPDGDVHISRSEFDALLGNAEALVDVGASAFAPQLLEAYPDVKVILNTRRDLNAWHRSAIKALVEDLEDKLYLQVLRLMSADIFWSWELFVKTGFGGLFQSSSVKQGVLRNGKWIYRDHCNMIRGLVPKDRLLEWSVEDGWEPLCKVGLWICLSVVLTLVSSWINLSLTSHSRELMTLLPSRRGETSLSGL
jgi:hypothetical protein